MYVLFFGIFVVSFMKIFFMFGVFVEIFRILKLSFFLSLYSFVMKVLVFGIVIMIFFLLKVGL